MTIFNAETQLPISSLTFLARLKARHACGPVLQLDDEQRALFEAWCSLYPREKYRALHAAIKAGRTCLQGSDIFE